MRPALAWMLRLALALALGLGSATAAEDGVVGTWTVFIPDAFPLYTFTWRATAGGNYDEDGRETATGKPIQRTLHGRWSLQGDELVLRQIGIDYVFVGLLSGTRYAGILYLGDRAVSRFCAAKGESAPRDCSTNGKVKPLASKTGFPSFVLPVFGKDLNF